MNVNLMFQANSGSRNECNGRMAKLVKWEKVNIFRLLIKPRHAA